MIRESDPHPPTVSVIVPAYDSARTIDRCICNLATQETAHRFEVIVVHSGTDDTCARVLRQLPDARVIQLAARAVAARARNIGARVARGEILAFVDSDAYPQAGWIEGVVAAARSGYDLICGAVGNANPHSAVSRAEQLLMFNEFLPGTRQRPSWFALSGNMVLRRATFDSFGPFDELRAAEDVVFSRRLMAARGRILFYPGLTVLHNNRTEVGRYLRNQMLIGKHTAIARRLVAFADSPSYGLFLAVLPVSPLVKLGKLAWHLLRQDPKYIKALAREFPLIAVGVCAYCVGMVAGAIAGARRNGLAAEAEVEAEDSAGVTQGGARRRRLDYESVADHDRALG